MDCLEVILFKLFVRPVSIETLIKCSACRAFIYHGELEYEPCILCQEDIINEEVIIEFPCNHQFHYDCLF